MQTLEAFVRISAAACSNPICGKVLPVGEEFFADRLTEATYCVSCGTCLRFHRKKAEQRQEAVPLTFATVEENLR